MKSNGRWLILLALALLPGCGNDDKGPVPEKDAGFSGDGASPGEGCTFTSDCKKGLVCAGDLCLIPGIDAGPVDTGGGGGGKDAGIDLKNYSNNWAKGYSIQLSFKGGPADGDELIFHRDLYTISQAFSFGSTHYSQGEVGFAVQDTIKVMLPNEKGKDVEYQLEIWQNFGLVVGSSINPVHVDEVGDYPFGCKPPFLRIFFKGFAYKSTCPKLNGRITIQEYGNNTGQTMSGEFIGRLQAYFKQGPYPDDCNPDHTLKTCNKPDWYVEVKGYFGYELPEKDKGGG